MAATKTTRPGETLHREIVPLALRASKVAKILGINVPAIRARCYRESVAFLRIGDGSIRFLELDWQALTPWGDKRHIRPAPGEDGRSWLAKWHLEIDEFSIGEVAFALDISRKTLFKLIREGVLPCHRRGRAWFITRTALVRWLLSCRKPTSWEFRAGANL